MVWRLFVSDGANQNTFFVLPGRGKVTLGRNQRQADFILNDLYVAHAHCHIEVADGRVLVRAASEGAVTLLNGVKISEQEMRPGDVLRVGNSHLRLEPHQTGPQHEPDAQKAEPEPERPRELPHLPLERLGELAGHTLSHYTLGEVIGQGHHGVVFRARHTKTGTELALKVLSPELPRGADEMRTFVQGLKAVLPLRHPNLVSLYNAGKTGPYCWLALEHVEGDSLAQALREPDARRRSHWKPALRVALHLAQALEQLRQHRLVHGNITPANVLLGRDSVGRNKAVKLNDLMLRQALEGSALEEVRRPRKLAAEAGYLAPEQTRPGAPIDGVTDLYGLGAVIYARLTGGPPFQGDTPAETIRRINTQVPRKPIDVHSSIPHELSAAVMLLLARNPEDRCQSPRELLGLLGPLAEREEVEA
jgi:serine/threonine protein kinase